MRDTIKVLIMFSIAFLFLVIAKELSHIIYKSRLFVGMAYLLKTTVQVATSAIPLILGMSYGDVIL